MKKFDSIVLENNPAQEEAGFPLAKAALARLRASELVVQRRLYLAASIDRINGKKAAAMLALIDAEIARRNQ
jgi:hypothetical protein